MKYTFFTVSFLLLQFTIFGQGKVFWQTLNDKAFTVPYPEDWSILQSGEVGSNLYIYASLDSETDKFKENLNFTVNDISEFSFTLDEYVNRSVEELKTVFTDLVISKNEDFIYNDKACKKVIYTGKKGNHSLTVQEYFWIENKKASVLSFSYETKEEKYYKPIGEYMLANFKLN
jgi:hypothetical protein